MTDTGRRPLFCVCGGPIAEMRPCVRCGRTLREVVEGAERLGLAKGGQGRDAEDVVESAAVLVWTLRAVALIGAVILLVVAVRLLRGGP